MDMHLHCGLEREVPLSDWIDLAVKDGRKVIVALDHRELYDTTPEEHAAWVKERKFPGWYPTGMEGRRALMDDLARLAERRDVTAFRGWEVYEGELDEKLDAETIGMAEVVGWHISPNGEVAPCGATLLKRVRQIVAVQRRFGMPMVVFHPFSMRIERVQKDAVKRGQAVSALTAADYRFFQPGEQEELARLLRGKPIYIEIGSGVGRYWQVPVAREALTADIRPLAALGVRFTVSTDAHYVKHAQQPFEPDVYCAPLGVTPSNTNGLVRDLMRRRETRNRL
jgi:histidinol phosphatase-like PHP family hydrolase